VLVCSILGADRLRGGEIESDIWRTRAFASALRVQLNPYKNESVDIPNLPAFKPHMHPFPKLVLHI